MKKTKLVSLVTLIAAIILQIFTFCRDTHNSYEFGFAIGISAEYKTGNIIFTLINYMIPLIFILFFTSGSMQNLIQGYGKVLLVRNYSRTKLIVKQLFKNLLTLLIIVLFQCAAILYFNQFLKSVKSGILKSLIMYFVIMSAIIMLQCLLEFYLQSQIVNAVLFIFSFVSYCIVQVMGNIAVLGNVAVLKIILFPSLMFGMQNGALSGENIYYLFLCIGIILNTVLAVLCIRKFKKTDIF